MEAVSWKRVAVSKYGGAHSLTHTDRDTERQMRNRTLDCEASKVHGLLGTTLDGTDSADPSVDAMGRRHTVGAPYDTTIRI